MITNRVAKADSYPLHRFENILAVLPNVSYYSKLDLSQAYQELVVDEAAQELLTINTHCGLFKVKQPAAPGLFQRVMETVLQRIPSIVVYLDDILVVGSNRKEHDK